MAATTTCAAADLDPAAALRAGCLAPDGTPLSGKEPLRIGAIHIIVEEVFDTTNPQEDGAAYRLANALHYATRRQTIRQQLLFSEGDVFDAQRLEEAGRILRNRRYLYDARVQPGSCHPEQHTIDVQVRVRDVWSLSPGVSFGRKGGASTSRIELEDRNLFGRGKHLSFARGQSVDRTTVTLAYDDPNLLGSWWRASGSYADNSDGRGQSLVLERPFYSLDTRWSFGVAGAGITQRTPRYALGEKVDEFDERTERLSIHGGWSRGLEHGWTRRWLAGVRLERSRFTAPTGASLQAPLPAGRNLVYPWMGVELIEDDFTITRNQDQIQRIEDLQFGRHLRAEAGLATPGFGADGTAMLFALNAGAGYRLNHGNDSLFVDTSGAGRLQGGALRDTIMSATARYYRRQGSHRLLFASIEGSRAFNLDLDHQLLLGGDSGLRGYPLRFQSGDSRVLATVEQRFFTNWYPLRLFHVGAAVFADAGRTWGKDVFGALPNGWLADVGFGLRLGSARSALGNVLHLDVAFPLGGPPSGRDVQFLIQSRKSF